MKGLIFTINEIGYRLASVCQSSDDFSFSNRWIIDSFLRCALIEDNPRMEFTSCLILEQIHCFQTSKLTKPISFSLTLLVICPNISPSINEKSKPHENSNDFLRFCIRFDQLKNLIDDIWRDHSIQHIFLNDCTSFSDSQRSIQDIEVRLLT